MEATQVGAPRGEERAALKQVGVELESSWGYNGGLNPLTLTLETQHLDGTIVRSFLEESWRALE